MKTTSKRSGNTDRHSAMPPRPAQIPVIGLLSPSAQAQLLGMVAGLSLAAFVYLARELPLQTVLSAGAAVLFILLFGYALAMNSSAAAWRALDENSRIQTAIETILKDIGPISTGDFTRRVTVMDDNVTSAMAEAFNTTVDRLRTLVREIKSSADMVELASSESIEAAHKVSASADVQKNEMKDAVNGLMAILESTKKVAGMMGDAANVAKSSLDASSVGKGSVENSMKAMATVRTQMLETSKRLKRVGESTHEITKIAEGIADITDKTNILALNANVQAAAAGEAGRAFAAVAAEVQRLAVESEQQLKQITQVLEMIQKDTQEAMGAMEATTQQVVAATDVSQQAARELSRIFTVSSELAGLVNDIGNITDTQAKEAGTIANRMGNILSMNDATVQSMKSSIIDIEKITGMTARLTKSVAGFKVA